MTELPLLLCEIPWKRRHKALAVLPVAILVCSCGNCFPPYVMVMN